MIRMVADLELLANDHRDALGRPDFSDEAEGLGTAGEQIGELRELLRAQPRGGSGRRLTVQGFRASLARPL